MTEQAIIAGCLQKNPIAQRELYNLYNRKMLGVCYRYGHTKEDAEDMLQEAFIRIFTQINTFKNIGSFEGWMRRVVVHTCINILKRNKKFNDSFSIDYAMGLPDKKEMVTSLLQAKQVIECIRMLPMGYRTVLNLYAIEGCSHREIADLLEIEESTSRSQYTRAKALLEQMLVSKNILEKPKQVVNWAVRSNKM
jgi:RNA polymerase sigma-70 factor (ECF subfamily)